MLHDSNQHKNTKQEMKHKETNTEKANLHEFIYRMIDKQMTGEETIEQLLRLDKSAQIKIIEYICLNPFEFFDNDKINYYIDILFKKAIEERNVDIVDKLTKIKFVSDNIFSYICFVQKEHPENKILENMLWNSIPQIVIH